MSFVDSDAYLEAPEHVQGAASPELIGETIGIAKQYCHIPGMTYLLGDEGTSAWTDIARQWNPQLPEDFYFNRIKWLSIDEGKRSAIGAHRDHPDFEGEVDTFELVGSASAVVQDLGAITLKPGNLLRLVGWPMGRPYPSGRRYQMSFGRDDPRTEHSLRYSGPRQAVVLAYDAHPDRPKDKYT